MKYWVDPPDGWRYGFPKVWDKQAEPDWEKWLVKNGFPAAELGNLAWVRMWAAEKL